MNGGANGNGNGNGSVLKSIGAVVGSLLSGAVLWLSTTVISLNREMGVQSESLRALESKVEIKTEERYRASDAKRDFARVDEHLIELGRRIEGCERRR